MADSPRLPTLADFPLGTEFVVYEFDTPLAQVPGLGWVCWWGGVQRKFDPRGRLKPDNNWTADSFEQWVGLISDTLK